MVGGKGRQTGPKGCRRPTKSSLQDPALLNLHFSYACQTCTRLQRTLEDCILQEGESKARGIGKGSFSHERKGPEPHGHESITGMARPRGFPRRGRHRLALLSFLACFTHVKSGVRLLWFSSELQHPLLLLRLNGGQRGEDWDNGIRITIKYFLKIE